MAFYLIHAGTSLQKVNSSTGALTNITLPTGVTVVDTRPIRVALLAGNIVVTNATSANIVISPSDLSTRLLSITGPSAALTAVAGAAGNLTGQYRFAYSYAITSGATTLVESPLSPIAGPLALTSQQASLSGITVSATSGVNCRIIYQTTNSGVDYYETTRLNDNTTTTATVNTSDYDLALLPVAEGKGNPPGTDSTDRFRLITTWKDRLFASPNLSPDYIYISGNREVYSWPTASRITANPANEDTYGVTAFMARRNELVIGKRRRIMKLIGDSPSNYELLQVTEATGIINQDACVVVRDECYFLAEDGFYRFGNRGLENLTRATVHPWFTTDTYFNRAAFTSAFAKYNAQYDCIELHLPSAGQTTINRWVRYDLRTGQWFGIDQTDAFTPTSAGAMDDTNGFSTPVVGSSSGFLYRQNQSTQSDDDTAIEMEVISKFHNANNPDAEKYWGELSIISKIESAGTLQIYTRVGDLNADEDTGQRVPLDTDRNVLGRVGQGRFAQFRFFNNELAQGVTLYGYELPYFIVGRR